MDDRFDPMREQQMIDGRHVGQVPDGEPIARHCGAMAHGEVVENANIMPAGENKLDGMAADIPGAAGDEDVHEGIVARRVTRRWVLFAAFTSKRGEPGERKRTERTKRELAWRFRRKRLWHIWFASESRFRRARLRRKNAANETGLAALVLQGGERNDFRVHHLRSRTCKLGDQQKLRPGRIMVRGNWTPILQYA